MSGYQKTEEELQQISEKKTVTDRQKGQTLEEISKIVTGVCVGKSCVLRAKAMCMLVWLAPIRSGGREQRSVAPYFPCC